MLLLWNGAWHGFFAAHHLSFLQGLEVSACPTSMHRLTAKTIGEGEGIARSVPECFVSECL